MRSLPTISRQDVMTFSVFVVVSFIFWIVQSGYEKNDVTREVTLSIENMPSGAVFTTRVPSTIRVTLYDSNVRLIGNGASSRFRRLTVDFNRYADVAGNFRISGAELTSLLKNELPSSTQITAMSPSLIDARYALTEGKKVPVRLRADLMTRGNFRDFAPVIEPDSVLVHAPNSILDTLTCIYTESVRRFDLRDTLRERLGMDLGLGVKATPDSVLLTVPVVEYVGKVLRGVPVRVEGMPAGCRMVLFPRRVDVHCLVNMAHYNKVNASDVKVTVSYDSLRNDPDRTFLPLQVQSNLPESELYNLKPSVQQVEYSIEKR